MDLNQYITAVTQRFQSGNAREHSYRGDLEQLIRTLVVDIHITNEPANVTDCGNPDYVITNHDNIPIGYIEAKDIGKDLNHKSYHEQFNRYKKALDNLIITDYLWFQFFQNGELVHEIRIAEISNGKVKPLPDNFDKFTNLIQNFCTFISQTIKSPLKLAEMMAAKARLLENILTNAIESDEKSEEKSSIQDQYGVFKNILIHDLTPKGFADIYAQTLAYGMFAARLHDPTLSTFSRQEAAELIPKTNPFLRKLFNHIASVDIDERIKPTVDNLADVFRATDINELLKNFGSSTQRHDPIIHFYETFLAEYDPALRKARGVWYTPEPVVQFIVRAVDDILKGEFGIKGGLADSSKTTIQIDSQTPDKRSKTGYKPMDKEVHKVQILDPATGTGTFLAEVIKYIYSQKFQSMHGVWSSYVEEHLIPRLNGFEILMASYAMAHLKLDLLLQETGFKAQKQQRFNVFLTNSLEEHHPDTGTLFSSWLSSEASEANLIKRDTPVMVVMGNPPYSGESQNKSKWIMQIMEDYKKEPDSNDKLKERNPKWINDDYVKFMRYAQYYIEKNGEGILAFINPHGFLDNPTFRGMRWNLLKTYDKIYTIDLHGNAKKKETTPDGGKDENVFDIMQGVSINVLVKTGKKKNNALGQVYHHDVYGKRDDKYQFLDKHNLTDIPFKSLPNTAPMYFMVQKDFAKEADYNQGFAVNELFTLNNVGIVTSRDSFVINEDKAQLEKQIKDFFLLEKTELQNKYKLKENKSWKINEVKNNAKEFNSAYIKDISYLPFDQRFIYNDNEFIERNRNEVMQHFIDGENLGLSLCKQFKSGDCYQHIFITNLIIESSYVSNKTSEITSIFPLYLYANETNQDAFQDAKRKPNLNSDIVQQMAEKLSLAFVPEKEQNENTSAVCYANSTEISDEYQSTFAPIDVLDYIYAVLHNPTYRETYKEFLKIDFPRIPYPEDSEKFWQLVKLGGQIRQIHLLESPILDEFITSYPQSGNNVISRKMTTKSIGFEATDEDLGKVWINDDQYFDKVPLIAWEFYIGGYQPAQNLKIGLDEN